MSDNTDEVTQALDALLAQGCSAAYFERVTSIPFGSLDQWRKGNIQPEELALLRLVRRFPWILELLDTGARTERVQTALQAALRDAQVAVLETLADRMTHTALGDSRTVARVRSIIYDLRDSLK